VNKPRPFLKFRKPWPDHTFKVLLYDAYGSQVYSRVAEGRSIITDKEFPVMSIHVPRISSIPANAEILAELDDDFVTVRCNNTLLTTFHPELTRRSPFTEYFLDMAMSSNAFTQGLAP
jgi:glutamine amidotransferase PdxT